MPAKPAAPAVKPGAPAPIIASPAAVAAAAAPALTPPAPPKYEPKGRRDPFESLESRLGSDRSTVATAKLTGLVRSGAATLALVETSDGIGYILKPGDTLADGRLLEIGPNMVVFGLAPKPGATTNRVVLKLTSD
jgi:Tfp pilus assembly protein PilP